MVTTKNNIFIMLFLLSTLIIAQNDKKISVKFEKVATFGKNDGNKNEMLGIIDDLAVDKEDNLYVLDYSYKMVKKFSPDGKLIQVFGKGAGNGPGEFVGTRGIDIDNWGNVYVTDMKQNRITIFDNKNNIIKSINTKYRPAYVQAFSTGEFYTIGFKPNINNKGIMKYNLSVNKDEPVHQFGEIYKGEYSYEIDRAGFVDRIVKMNAERKIVQFDFYPYSLKTYDLNGNLLNTLTRKVSFYKPPVKVKSDPLYIKPSSGGMNICKISPTIVMAQIFRVDEDEEKILFYFDFWDIKKGEFLGSYYEKELGITTAKCMLGTEDGYFYNCEASTYPYIAKYKVIIDYK